MSTQAADPLCVERSPLLQNVLPFAIGGLSGCIATTCIQPVDVVKVRIQLAKKGTQKLSPLSIARTIVTSGKFTDLWVGLSAAYLRQLSYTTVRLGLFDRFIASASTHGQDVNFAQRALASLSAGGIASLIATPTEVALVRMQSDDLLPASQRAHYRNAFDALLRTARAEGVIALWKGSLPTVAGAMARNFGSLGFFSETKKHLHERTQLSSGLQTAIACSVAGFFASLFGLPFDFIKSRLQRATKGIAGVPEYKGMFDCASRAVREEGILRFYRGFGTYVLRIAPHTFITLMVADTLNGATKPASQIR